MSELALRLIRENIEKHQRGEDATYLDLGNCGLTHLPPELGECGWVETLILSNQWSEYDLEMKMVNKVSQNRQTANVYLPNRIFSIKGVERLITLKKLVVSKHYIDRGENWDINDLTPLTRLVNLQILHCNSTQISDLLPLAHLDNLQILHCFNTKIRDLSPLSKLHRLEQLFCGSTLVSDLKPISGLRKLQILNCTETNITDLEPLKGLVSLQYLDCSDTRIGDINPLEDLVNLQSLWLSGEYVKDLFPLGKLLNLRELQLSNYYSHSDIVRYISLDTNVIKSLKSLKSLWISTYDIGDLSFLMELEFLEELNISSSKSINFNVLSSLKNLETLYCSFTQFSDLEALAGLVRLKYLDIRYTQVSNLSPLLPLIKLGMRVGKRMYLGGISLEGCPLTNPPIEVVEQGNEAILNYFAEKDLTGTEKSLEAKVVLIGEGQAGKTSLRTRLLRPGQALPNKEDRTKGLDIEIEKHKYLLPSGEEMRLNIFDFGGQDHYKPLHQFFYSKNTLYVLVSKNGDVAVNDFDFWLDTAQLFGQNSPVLLVHNLFGDVRSSFNRSKYERFEETIKDCLDVNLADFEDRRWAEVQSRIEYFASRLPHVHEEIPKSWANVRRALAARREEQVLNLEDYLTLCALEENGAMDEERALHCSAYLHNIGIILHYQDDADLREYIIVKNEWATDAAYRVIDDPEIAQRNGHFFRQTDLPRIWYQPEYRKMRPQLLQLMRNFRLCYPLKAEGEFIAPQLLPSSPPPGYAWQPASDLVLYVEYDFMPPGLMAQLLVECHQLIAQDRRLVWRDGAVLELPGRESRAEILLQKRGGKQTIGIRAQGRKKRDLMTIVDARLEELHRPFGSGLKVEKKIPCICERCEKTDDKWFFNLSELENRLKAGIKHKDCEMSYQKVLIDDLLGNVFSEEVRKQGVITAPLAFFSYSKADALYLKEFKKHLSTFTHNGDLMHWDDTKIRPGEEWDDAIKSELKRADIIFLLISVDFLNTDYIWEVEIREAMRRHQAKEAIVVPIKIRDCVWGNTVLGNLQGLPRKEGIIGPNPVNDTAWTEVVEEIQEVLRKRG